MTIKEAILKSLEDLKQPSNTHEIYSVITDRGYYHFDKGKTPKNTISAQLGDFIRKNDTRVQRVKGKNGIYFYALTKNSVAMKMEALDRQSQKRVSYKERDLHKLLSTYLKHEDIYTKTILHEESKNAKDDHQKWIHPDMIGIEFVNLESTVNRAFMKVLNKSDTFKLSSYEIKREINTDYELKKCYFQAVSNSSWANYGYLVAFEINDRLKDEMERLNQSFGIGIVKLHANPYESKILFQAKFRELDFKTIDKLCKVNPNYEKFIELTEKALAIEERYYSSIKKEFDTFCDRYFENDSQIEAYCHKHAIPWGER
jgi:hypothetical protein